MALTAAPTPVLAQQQLPALRQQDLLAVRITALESMPLVFPASVLDILHVQTRRAAVSQKRICSNLSLIAFQTTRVILTTVPVRMEVVAVEAAEVVEVDPAPARRSMAREACLAVQIHATILMMAKYAARTGIIASADRLAPVRLGSAAMRYVG